MKPTQELEDGFESIVSSNLHSAKFEKESGAIVVRFQNGTAYRYPNCSDSLWKDFQKQFDGQKGRSAGKFLHAQLKPRPYEQLEDWK